MRSLSRLLAALALCLATPSVAQDQSLPARLEAIAAQGNAEAAYHLGMLYHLGLEGVARDPRRAFEYFQRAAEGGDALGAYKVGCFYAGQGEGVVEPDEALALRYKLRAAEAGYDLAQVDVAQIYHERGEFDRALQWLEAAAQQGNAEGIGGAIMYRAHGGPRPDGPRAWLYFELMQRHMSRMIETLEVPGETVSDADRATAIQESRAQLRQLLIPDETESDRERAARLVAAWREERSPVSLRADEGLNAARRLAEIPIAASE